MCFVAISFYLSLTCSSFYFSNKRHETKMSFSPPQRDCRLTLSLPVCSPMPYDGVNFTQSDFPPTPRDIQSTFALRTYSVSLYLYLSRSQCSRVIIGDDELSTLCITRDEKSPGVKYNSDVEMAMRRFSSWINVLPGLYNCRQFIFFYYLLLNYFLTVFILLFHFMPF